MTGRLVLHLLWVRPGLEEHSLGAVSTSSCPPSGGPHLGTSVCWHLRLRKKLPHRTCAASSPPRKGQPGLWAGHPCYCQSICVFSHRCQGCANDFRALLTYTSRVFSGTWHNSGCTLAPASRWQMAGKLHPQTGWRPERRLPAPCQGDTANCHRPVLAITATVTATGSQPASDKGCNRKWPSRLKTKPLKAQNLCFMHPRMNHQSLHTTATSHSQRTTGRLLSPPAESHRRSPRAFFFF